MAAGQKIRSCWCLTFPPGLCKTETVINSHSLALCWRLSSALKEFRRAEIPEVMLVSVFLVTTLKEWAFFFPGVLYFLPVLLSCLACCAQDFFAHWVTKEIKRPVLKGQGRTASQEVAASSLAEQAASPVGRYHLQSAALRAYVSPDMKG